MRLRKGSGVHRAYLSMSPLGLKQTTIRFQTASKRTAEIASMVSALHPTPYSLLGPRGY